jgi:transposase
MKPYSMDLRQRVLGAYDNGEGTQEELAGRFCVSVRWIQKVLRWRRETGSLEPKGHGGGRAAKIAGELAVRLRQAVEATPDATLAELREKCGVAGSIMCVFRALARLQITRKKSRRVTPSS